VLAQVALLSFALCALLSLAIDIGYARLTQGQMQNAADTAALEGLRRRDVGVRNPVTGAIVNDPFASDCIRRASANRLVRWTFDDDLDATNGETGYQFGAGPVVNLTEGVTSAHALQTVSIPEQPVYKPDPQLNQRNQVYGDMVSGRFCYTTDPRPSEGGEYELQDIVCTAPQRGSGIYSRGDFNPSGASPSAPAGLAECPLPDDAPPNPWPLGGTGSLDTVDDSGFLVRLRRSNELQGFVDQVEPSVASSGPSLPLLPGKGAAIHGDDPTSDYSVRRDGLTVRATAIASVRPAMHIGLAQATPAQPGVTRYALTDACVQAANGAAVTVTVSINPATGLITRTGAGTPGCATGAVVGRFVANALTVDTVGELLPLAPSAAPCVTTATAAGQYAPVSSAIGAGPARIIGFTRVNFTRVATCPAGAATAYTATIVRGVSLVAAANASAVMPGALPLPITATAAAVRELLEKNRMAPGRANYAPVLVAVLAR